MYTIKNIKNFLIKKFKLCCLGLEGDDESISSTPLIKKRVLSQPQSSSIKTGNTSILSDILAASNVPPKIQTSKRKIFIKF